MRGTLTISNFNFFFKIKINEKMTSKGATNVETLIVNAKREKQQIKLLRSLQYPI